MHLLWSSKNLCSKKILTKIGNFSYLPLCTSKYFSNICSAKSEIIDLPQGAVNARHEPRGFFYTPSSPFPLCHGQRCDFTKQLSAYHFADVSKMIFRTKTY